MNSSLEGEVLGGSKNSVKVLFRFVFSIAVIIFIFLAAGPNLFSAPKEEVPLGSVIVQDLREFLKEEENIAQQMQQITAPNGTLEEISQSISDINSKRRRYELKIKWIFVCPASFLINLGLAMSGLAKAFPPYSEGLAPAVGMFGMLYVFDVVDKYWNRHFQQDIDEGIADFIAKAIEIRRADEIQSLEAREVDFRNIEQARIAISQSAEREQQMTVAKQEVYQDYLRKRLEKRWSNKIRSSLGFKDEVEKKITASLQNDESVSRTFDDLRSRMLHQKLEQAYYQQNLDLLHQRAKLVTTIRSKFVHGDHRFRGKDRIACAQLLAELSASAAKSSEKPT